MAWPLLFAAFLSIGQAFRRSTLLQAQTCVCLYAACFLSSPVFLLALQNNPWNVETGAGWY